MSRMISRACLIVFSIFLASCAIGPNYKRPEIKLPETWRVAAAESQSVANLVWWESLGDSELNSLIVRALQNNQDLRIATARMEQFYARYGIARSELFPNVDLGGSYSRGEFSQAQFGDTPEFSSQGTQNNFSTALTLAWELDFWGRVRRSTEAARADLWAQEEVRRAAVLSLVSSVAQAYVNLRSLDAQLAIALRTRQNRAGSVKFAETRYDAGLTSELEVLQARTELAASEATVPEIETQLVAQENALSLLLGEAPQNITRGLPVAELAVSSTVPAGIPADVLENRPDVAQAEAQLRSANALVGVAYANYLPRVDLSGLFGYESLELSELVQRTSRTWSYGPTISLPIFNAGRLGSELEQARAAVRETEANFERSVLNALRETEDALVAFRNSATQLAARNRLRQASGRYADLAQRRYEEGQSPYLEVLDAQRRLFDAELKEASALADRVQSLISLYRALGGGWVEAAEETAKS